MLTDYHAKYFAHELTKRNPSDSIQKLAASLIDAQVDLNPHQIEADLPPKKWTQRRDGFSMITSSKAEVSNGRGKREKAAI